MDDQNAAPRDAAILRGESELAAEDTSVADVRGSPTWPIAASAGAPPPPAGLNWGTVSQRLGIDLRLLEHDGAIVVAGEYFPFAGFLLDPASLQAQHVDVGDIALNHGYLLGDLTAREFREMIPLAEGEILPGRPVIRRESAPIIGLFADEVQAQRARSAILQGSVGSGARSETGPLGIELRVDQTGSPGAVATVIAANRGAVISIGGRPVRGPEDLGPLSTAPIMPAAEADAFREGIGAEQDSEAVAREYGSSEGFQPL